MSISTDSPPGACAAADTLGQGGEPKATAACPLHIWRPVGLVYLAMLLIATAAGLWPAAIYPPRAAVTPAPLPILQTLAVAQTAFFLLVYPLALNGRRVRGQRRYSPATVLESAGLLAVAAPFYLLGGFLADAVWVDALRTGLYVAGLVVASWGAALWLGGRRSGAIVLAVMLLTAIGLPGGYYVAREFLSAEGHGVWRLAPLTFAWEVARSRAGDWLPRPVWAAGIWPTAGLVCMLARAVFGGERRPAATRSM